MGLETAVAIGAGSSLVGGAFQYAENRAARKRAQSASDTALGITSAPTINIGQDSFLQQLRSNPDLLKPFMFDTSKAFSDLRAQDLIDTQDQVNQLRSSAGSLGQRFGSGFATKEALLRARIAAAQGTRNAGIAQNSFDTALSTGLQSNQQQIGLLQLIQQGMFQQRAQQLQALGLGTSQQYPSNGQLISQTGGDIGTLLTLMSLLGKNKTPGAGGSVNVPAPTVGSYSGGWPG